VATWPLEKKPVNLPGRPVTEYAAAASPCETPVANARLTLRLRAPPTLKASVRVKYESGAESGDASRYEVW
jgi:hypothetical protein